MLTCSWAIIADVQLSSYRSATRRNPNCSAHGNSCPPYHKCTDSRCSHPHSCLHSHCCAISSKRGSLLEARSALRNPNIDFLNRNNWFEGSLRCWVSMAFEINVLTIEEGNGFCSFSTPNRNFETVSPERAAKEAKLETTAVLIFKRRSPGNEHWETALGNHNHDQSGISRRRTKRAASGTILPESTKRGCTSNKIVPFSTRETVPGALWEAFGNCGIPIGKFGTEVSAIHAAQSAAVGQLPVDLPLSQQTCCNTCHAPMEKLRLTKQKLFLNVWKCSVCLNEKVDCQKCGTVVDEKHAARHRARCQTAKLAPSCRLREPPKCPLRACDGARAIFTGSSKVRKHSPDTYECTSCFKRFALCSLCHELQLYRNAQRHFKICLTKHNAKGEKWASFFEHEDIPSVA